MITINNNGSLIWLSRSWPSKLSSVRPDVWAHSQATSAMQLKLLPVGRTMTNGWLSFSILNSTTLSTKEDATPASGAHESHKELLSKDRFVYTIWHVVQKTSSCCSTESLGASDWSCQDWIQTAHQAQLPRNIDPYWASTVRMACNPSSQCSLRHYMVGHTKLCSSAGCTKGKDIATHNHFFKIWKLFESFATNLQKNCCWIKHWGTGKSIWKIFTLKGSFGIGVGSLSVFRLRVRADTHTKKKDRRWSNSNGKSQPKIIAKWHLVRFKITNGHSLSQIQIDLRIQRLLTFCKLRAAQGPLWSRCIGYPRRTAAVSLCFHQEACWTVDFHLGNHGRQIVHQSAAQSLLNGGRNPDISTVAHRSLIAMVTQHSHANHQKGFTLFTAN